MSQPARKLDLHKALAGPECAVLTLLELVAAVAEEAESDGEVLAVVTHLVNSGKVKLIGSFRGADVLVR